MVRERDESFSDVASDRFVDDILDFAVDASEGVGGLAPGDSLASHSPDSEVVIDLSDGALGDRVETLKEGSDRSEEPQEVTAEQSTERFDLPDDGVVVVDVDAGTMSAPGSTKERTLMGRVIGWARRVKRLYL